MRIRIIAGARSCVLMRGIETTKWKFCTMLECSEMDNKKMKEREKGKKRKKKGRRKYS